ncbi:MAG: HD domain-containing protein [Tannerella sp.]|jgi:5'(3')-deoxyribonucleotidase|nr:HD domain-containing protein [Tannerella sp.]
MDIKKKILYFDMDNVLVDFQSGIDRLSEDTKREYEGYLDEVSGIFSLMKPASGAVEAVKLLSQHFDCYILSTAPWKNLSAWTDKAEWVHKYFGSEKDGVFYKRLIISHHKNLNKGDYLIDDRTKNGAGEFHGELILFGSERFPDWKAVIRYLIPETGEAMTQRQFSVPQMTDNIQSLYQQTLKYAAERHGNQKITGSEIPYVVHLSNVCMEILLAAQWSENFDLRLAIPVALLHDVLEDTLTSEDELTNRFGQLVTSGVKALTKNDALPKEEQMSDSLRRIKQMSKEIWAVKLADRISNLQPPPAHWTQTKIVQYREEAQTIYDELKDGNAYLADRLKSAIIHYAQTFPLINL